MPEPSKRVVVEGIAKAEALFGSYVGARLAVERSSADLAREVADLEREAEELERQVGATAPTRAPSFGDLVGIDADLARAGDLLGEL